MFHLPARLAAVLLAAFACLQCPALAQDTPDLPPMTEVSPGVWSTNPSLGQTTPAPPDDRECVRFWRPAYYAAQAADIATTIYAIESGKGREANPVYTTIFGKHVRWWQVAGMKVLTIAAMEVDTRRIMRVGNYGLACKGYRFGAIITGGVAALNLRIVF